MPDLNDHSANPPALARHFTWLLCAVWLLAGSIGHDPWKSDDALHLGVAWGMSGGDWLVPRIAGDPWLVTPPLYHWLAAVMGQALGWMLPWHDAARLASVVFGTAFLLALSRAATVIAGASAGLAAPLLAIGTLGLLVPLHEAQPGIPGMAGLALALLGLSAWREQPRSGALSFGLGTGIAFLGAGIDHAVMALGSALVLLLHPDWRGGKRLMAWPIALTAALLLVLPWPLALWQKSPALFELWWRSEQDSLSAGGAFSRDHLELLAWAAWPVLPLALWAIWLERRRLWRSSNVLMLVASAAGLLTFLLDSQRPAALLPALVPLTLLATVAAGRLRRGAANALDWFGMMTFTLVAGLIWLGAISMITGEPARVAKNFTKPAPGFIAEIHPLAILLAIGVTVAWIAVMLRTPRTPWRAAARWSLGLSIMWLLLMLLWLPWIDYGKSYRGVSADLRQHLGRQPGCIARQGLGLSQRASFDYFAGIRTVSRRNSEACKWMIVQTVPKTAKDLDGWTLVRETSRPGDKSERLRLYRRN